MPAQSRAQSQTTTCRAGYIKFLFFLARGAKVAILRQVLRVGVYAMGRTLIQPFHQVLLSAASGHRVPCKGHVLCALQARVCGMLLKT